MPEETKPSVLQQIFVQVVVAALAGFLGTYVGVEVVKEKVVNLSDRIDKVEQRVMTLEHVQTTMLESQVQMLTKELQKREP